MCHRIDIAGVGGIGPFDIDYGLMSGCNISPQRCEIKSGMGGDYRPKAAGLCEPISEDQPGRDDIDYTGRSLVEVVDSETQLEEQLVLFRVSNSGDRSRPTAPIPMARCIRQGYA